MHGKDCTITKMYYYIFHMKCRQAHCGVTMYMHVYRLPTNICLLCVCVCVWGGGYSYYILEVVVEAHYKLYLKAMC